MHGAVSPSGVASDWLGRHLVDYAVVSVINRKKVWTDLHWDTQLPPLAKSKRFSRASKTWLLPFPSSLHVGFYLVTTGLQFSKLTYASIKIDQPINRTHSVGKYSMAWESYPEPMSVGPLATQWRMRIFLLKRKGPFFRCIVPMCRLCALQHLAPIPSQSAIIAITIIAYNHPSVGIEPSCVGRCVKDSA